MLTRRGDVVVERVGFAVAWRLIRPSMSPAPKWLGDASADSNCWRCWPGVDGKGVSGGRRRPAAGRSRLKLVAVPPNDPSAVRKIDQFIREARAVATT